MGRKACPECGRSMDRQSKRCASCSGYGRKRNVMPSGYVRVWIPGHPTAHRDGYALEHRYVLHEAGVEVPDGFHVHHRNGVKTDNRIENLEVMPAGEHHRHHIREAGVVTNQYGTFPVATTDEQRRERARARNKAKSAYKAEWQRRKRAQAA